MGRAGRAGREGKGGILAEVSLPPSPPIYCLWLFCDEREIEIGSRSVVLRGKITDVKSRLAFTVSSGAGMEVVLK